jgi:16S rRNA (guanine966-N2)-methyltransferase
MAKASAKRPAGQLRIIGGRFRGRRLPIPDLPGLRPTGDRLRETLFNWLAPSIAGSCCLDAFAGSGALGLEAASRGAAQVVMIERSERALAQLGDSVRVLGDTCVEVVELIGADTVSWLSAQPPAAFDVIFLDPPFAAGLLEPVCGLLQARGWVKSGSLVYLEAALPDGFPALPDGWTLLRDKRAGQVRYGLAAVEAARAAMHADPAPDNPA